LQSSVQTIKDTIVAQATPTGRGGVGVIRCSGPLCLTIASRLLTSQPQPRYAHYGPFLGADGQAIDQGIALFFPGPHSFTGEDVLELQGHGGPVIMDMLLREILALGTRLALPGEFSQRAFINGKLDLAQAEAIADLIDSGSEQAARYALRSLQGDFSKQIERILKHLIKLRTYLEATIDFADEEIDFIDNRAIEQQLTTLIDQLQFTLSQAQQGVLLKEGMTLVIAGRPNVGKSSLLNALAGKDRAIVTSQAGTTRDLVREHIQIAGMPLHLIDTAGLHTSQDQVEQLGIERAWEEIKQADAILLVVDSSCTARQPVAKLWPEFLASLPQGTKLTLVRNKIDLTNEPPGLTHDVNNHPVVALSAKQGQGIEELRHYLKDRMGRNTQLEGGFIARRRHLDALQRAKVALTTALHQLQQNAAIELLAEDLRQAQQALGEITGEFTADDLLGEIFSSFCIGK
jgi:tRNA modification GTPase